MIKMWQMGFQKLYPVQRDNGDQRPQYIYSALPEILEHGMPYRKNSSTYMMTMLMNRCIIVVNISI